MPTETIRVLIVDDYEPWRRFVRSLLEKQPELHVVSEVADGAEAVRKAQELEPDLILLDIGLPTLGGIEAARRVRERVPGSKIIFVSQNRDRDMAEEALRTGALGYVVKSAAGSELLAAIEAVVEGKQFVSTGLDGRSLTVNPPQGRSVVAPLPPQNVAIRHEVAFYRDDTAFIDRFARLAKAALNAGNPVILVATEPHRVDILQKLRADSVDVDAARENGTYIPLDVIDTLSEIMIGHLPDPVRCAKVVGDLIARATKNANTNNPRVAICGECAPTLLTEGNVEGAIRLEHLWDEITRRYPADTLCGYVWNTLPDEGTSAIYERICAEHSAIHGRELGY